MCARAKALPSAGCALPPAEGLFPSGPPALTTRPSPYLGRSSPGELIRPPFRPSRLQLPRPHLKSLVAIVYWLAGGRHATRLSRRHSAPPLSAIMWRACARSFGWGGAEGKGLCSARAVERRGHPDLWGSILEAFITSDFRPGVLTQIWEPSSVETALENDEFEANLNWSAKDRNRPRYSLSVRPGPRRSRAWGRPLVANVQPACRTPVKGRCERWAASGKRSRVLQIDSRKKLQVTAWSGPKHLLRRFTTDCSQPPGQTLKCSSIGWGRGLSLHKKLRNVGSGPGSVFKRTFWRTI